MDKVLVGGYIQRTAANGFMSRQRPETSGIPRGLVLGLLLFNIFASNMDSEIEFTTSKSSDNFAKTCDVAECWREGMTPRRTLAGLTWPLTTQTRSQSMAMQVNNRLELQSMRLLSQKKVQPHNTFAFTVFLKCVMCLKCVMSYYIQSQ